MSASDYEAYVRARWPEWFAAPDDGVVRRILITPDSLLALLRHAYEAGRDDSAVAGSAPGVDELRKLFGMDAQ